MRVRSVVGFLVLAAQAGCLTGPRRVEYAPRQYLNANQPSHLWLTLNDGSEVVVVGPKVIADTVFGWTENGNEELTIAISDVKEVRARQVSAFRTALIPVTFAAALTATVIIVKKPKGEAPLSSDALCEIDEDC